MAFHSCGSVCQERSLRITHGLCKKDPLGVFQAEFTNRVLFVAIMEPGCKSHGGRIQVNILGDKSRIGIVIGFLNLGIPYGPVRLIGTQVIAGEIGHIKDVYRRRGRPPPVY